MAPSEKSSPLPAAPEKKFELSKPLGTMGQAKALVEWGPIQERIRALLPQGYPLARFTAVFLNCVSQNPKLLNCTGESILLAMRQAAELRLEPSGPLGHGWLIPYGQDAKFQPGYRGYAALMRRSGVLSIKMNLVFKGEAYRYAEGMETTIEHEPTEGPDRTYDDIVAAYDVVALPTGIKDMPVVREAHWMWKADIDKARATSKQPNGDGWTKWWHEMAKKSCLRRHAKLLPLDGEAWQRLLEIDNEHYDIEGERIVRHSAPLTPDPDPMTEAELGQYGDLAAAMSDALEELGRRQGPDAVADYRKRMTPSLGLEGLKALYEEVMTRIK